MKKILISEDALGDLNDGFLFYEAQEFGLGDYFTACLRANIEGLKITAGSHRRVHGFHRLLSRVFLHVVFYTVQADKVTILTVIALRRNPDWITSRLNTE